MASGRELLVGREGERERALGGRRERAREGERERELLVGRRERALGG